MLEDVPVPEVVPGLRAVLAAEDGLWLSRWYGTGVEDPDERGPATEWRVIGFTPSVQVYDVEFPPGVKPIRPLPGLSALVILQDELGRQGIGLARVGRNGDA
jgi:hypothetical protein